MMDHIDNALLITLPFLFAAKTGGFAVLTMIMARQHARTALGTWLLRLFGALTLVSLCLTMLFARFAILWHDVDLSRWVLFMAPLAVLLAVTVYAGAQVMQAERRAHKEDAT